MFKHWKMATRHLEFVGLWFGLFCMSQAYVIFILGPAAHDLFRLQLTTDSEAFMAIISEWGPQEWEGFRKHFLWDSFHPIVYSTALLVGISNALHRLPSVTRWVLAIPLLSGLFDYLENYFHSQIQMPFSDNVAMLIAVGGTAAIIKWLLALTSLLLIVVLQWRARLSGPLAPPATPR